jgi:hypothetical protein
VGRHDEALAQFAVLDEDAYVAVSRFQRSETEIPSLSR